MARGMNHIRLIGAVANAPELRYTPSGLAILTVTLVGDERLIDQDGTERALPWYHRISVFGAQAERYAEVPVGSVLSIDGRLDFRTWDTDAGEKRNALDVVALRVEMLDTTNLELTHDAKNQPRLVNAVNEVVLIGNLTRDAELRTTSGGHALAAFGVAVNERFRAKNATEDSETVHFVEVRAWRDVAERCQGLSKGAAVQVRGRLVTDSWEDQAGNRKYMTRVEGTRVDQVTFFQKAA